MLNVVPGGLTPGSSPRAWSSWAFGRDLPRRGVRTVANAAIAALTTLRKCDGAKADRYPQEFFDLFGLSEWNELGERYRAYAHQGDVPVGMTIIEKILAEGPGASAFEVGELVVLRRRHDRADRPAVRDDVGLADPDRGPDRLAVIMDHAVPAPSIADADGGVRARAFAAQHGVERFFDIGRHGICHQVIAENGLARPGEILTCTDSHTCAAGAYNAAARGLGPVEVYSIMCTGQTWFQLAPTLRYELTGREARRSSAARTSSCTSRARTATRPTTTSSSGDRAFGRCR